MIDSKFVRWTFLLCSLVESVLAGIYYDPVSCSQYLSFLNNGVPAAFEMGQLAQIAIGASIQDTANSKIWGFPDTESRDLVERIFGPPTETTDNFPGTYHYIKNGFDFVMNNFAVQNSNGIGFQGPLPADPNAVANSIYSTTTNPNANLLTPADVVLYCDLTRYKINDDNKLYVSSIIGGDTMEVEEFTTCSKTFRQNRKGDSVVAYTERPNRKTGEGVGYGIIQFCPWYLGNEKTLRYHTHLKLIPNWIAIPRYWYRSPKTKIAAKISGDTMVDKSAWFCQSLLHELMHAVLDNNVRDANTARLHNVDVKLPARDQIEAIGSYNWRNIIAMGAQPFPYNKGYINADSLGYFGLGVQQLTKGNRFNSDGTVTRFQPAIQYTAGSPNNVLVDWSPSQNLRVRIPSSTDIDSSREVPRGRFLRQATGTAFTSSATSLSLTNVSIQSNISLLSVQPLTFAQSASMQTSSDSSTAFSTGIIQSVTVSPIWKNSSILTPALSTGYSVSSKVPLPWLANVTTSAGTNILLTSSMIVSSPNPSATSTQIPLDTPFDTAPPSSGTLMPSGSSLSPAPFSTQLISSIAIPTPDSSSNFTSNNITFTAPSVGISPISTGVVFSDLTFTSTQSGGFITIIKTSTLVMTTSDSSSFSLCTATNEVDRIWCSASVTPTPTDTLTVPIFWEGSTPSSTVNVYSIFTASTLYIPSITNLNSFPTVLVKNPDPQSTDDIKIPFVKVTIPKNACEPLPKVNHGGLLGAVFNLASDLVDGALDDACHLVFPNVKGIKLPLPDWLTLDIYPSSDTFPDDSDNEESSTTSSSSTTTSSSSPSPSSSSSSSCSASVVPYCTNSCVISGTITQSCTSICSTTTMCSGTAKTASITSSVCSASAVSSCIASCTVSAGSTQSCSTICSTITACSNTATTSSTITSLSAVGTASWDIDYVPWNYTAIQASIQSELAEAFAAAPSSLDYSSYLSALSSFSAEQSSLALSATGSQQIFNSSSSPTQSPSSTEIFPTLASSTGLAINSSIPGLLPSGTLSAVTGSITFAISTLISASLDLSSSSNTSEPSTTVQLSSQINTSLVLSLPAATSQVSSQINPSSAPSSAAVTSILTSDRSAATSIVSSDVGSATSDIGSITSNLSGAATSSQSSSQVDTSLVPSSAAATSQASILSNPTSESVISSVTPAPDSTIAAPSSHVASTTTPAIEAETPINMFQMNFWHETDNNNQSTGNLWYMYVNKLVDINLGKVDLCAIAGKAGIEDQNITNTDPLPSPWIPYPEGSWDLPTDGAGNGCYYKGDQSTAGDVFCPGKPTVSCQGNAGDSPTVCDANTKIYPMVLCGLEN